MTDIKSVRLTKGNRKGDVNIFSNDRILLGGLRDTIKAEIDILGDIKLYDKSMFFSLMPDGNYQTYDEFLIWIADTLEFHGYQPHKDIEANFVKE